MRPEPLGRGCRRGLHPFAPVGVFRQVDVNVWGWCTAGGEAIGMDWRGVIGAESAHEHYVRVKEQFEITWAWIGRNIGDLWD